MIRPGFIEQLYEESYEEIRKSTASMSHDDSLWQPPFGGNCVNWLLGHLVVSRCNFLMLLDVSSVWTMDQCRRFMPGSPPIAGHGDSEPLITLLKDFGRTQVQLCDALTQTTAEELSVIKGERTVAESLLFYQVHESFHAGQIELLSGLIPSGTGN